MTALPTAFSGVSFLIQVEDPGASGTYRTVGGLKATSGSLDAGQFDTSTKDGTRWARAITGGQLKMALSGGGCFVDDPVLTYLQTLIMANTAANFKLISANGDTYAGSFFLKAFGRSGPVSAAEDYTISLESNGTVTITYPTATVTAVTPATGPAAGSTAVVITGTKFRLGSTVSIGGVACTSVVVVDQTTINCITGVHASGLVSAVVTDPSAVTATMASAYTYT